MNRLVARIAIDHLLEGLPEHERTVLAGRIVRMLADQHRAQGTELPTWLIELETDLPEPPAK